MNPLEFSLLLVLEENDATYGYAIVKAIAERTHGAIRLAPGNLYQVLDRLVTRGWIRELKASQVPDGGDARRRYYALAPAGRRELRAEAARLRALMPTIDRLQLAPTPRGRR